jgi:predicted PurR-regulated permease PerM
MTFLLLVLAIAGWLLYTMMRPFLEPIFVAFILAVAFAPIHRRLRLRFRRPAVSATLSTLLVLLLVAGPILGLLAVVAQQGLLAYQSLSRASAADGGWGAWASHVIQEPLLWLSSKTGMDAPRIQEMAAGWVQSTSRSMLSLSGSLAGNLGASLTNTIIVFFTLFFLFLEGRGLQEGFLQWLPIERSRAEHLLSVTVDTINANLYGVVAVCAAQGGLTAVALAILGTPSWLFWGVVAAFASLIPLVGAALVWVPVALHLLVIGSWGKALFLGIWGVLVVGMADNFIRPWVISGRTSMSTLTVFFALIGGLNAFGLIGLVAGPLVFTLVITLYRIIEEIRREGAGEPAVPPTS